MGVVLADDIADGARRLLELGLGGQPQLGHGVDDAPLHRLEPVGDVGQGPVQDHVHGVVQVGLLGKVLEGDLLVGLKFQLGRH